MGLSMAGEIGEVAEERKICGMSGEVKSLGRDKQ